MREPDAKAVMARGQTWSAQTLDAWREAARAELDGGDPDDLATPLDAAVTMLPLFTRADLPPDPPAQASPPNAVATRLALAVADPATAQLVGGYDLVRVTGRRLQTLLANGETEEVRRLDPETMALTVAATPEGMEALNNLERTGLPHAVVLDLGDDEPAIPPAHELATTVCAVIGVLRGLGAVPAPRPSALAARLHLPLRLGTDLVTQVAKVRALRWLYHTVMTAFEVEGERRHGRIWARASSLCWSAIDPELNLGRAALQAFAAVVSGCEAFEPLPFDPVGAPDESWRLAANQHRLLTHEADLMRVHDPLAGAFAVESLTAQLAQQAWRLVQTWGRDGRLPAPAAVAAPSLVGTHRFADPAARVTTPPTWPGHRPAAAFEALRRRSAGHPVPALLVPFGDATAARPQTAWAADLLRTAGIEPTEGTRCATATDVQTLLAGHPQAQVVVLCGLDDRDGTLVRGVAAALGAAPSPPLLYATGEAPPGSETWGPVGFLHRGLDPAGTLQGILDRLDARA